MSLRTKTRTPKTPTSGADPKPVDRATEYATKVVAGEIVAGPNVRAACKRHLDDLRDGGKRGLVWDIAKANRAIGFIEDVCRLNGGEFEGRPFLLQLWQAFIVGSLFGWLGSDGNRRFRVAYVEIGKGNGKSPLAAAIGLFLMCADGEARAEVYAAATKLDQARILFRDAVAMVCQSPALKKRLTLTPDNPERCYNLSHLATSSWFRAIGSDSDSQSGPRPHGGLIDELHEHKNAVMVDMMRAGTKGRSQALMFEITNSGVDRTSVCYVHHEMSVRVVTKQQENDTWFAYVCGLDENDDPITDEKCWPKANPNLGVSIQPRYIREQVEEAKGMPSKLSTVLRLNFCQWVDASDPWIESSLWFACEDSEVDPERDWAGTGEFVGALDLSGTRDLTALAMGRRRDDGGVDAFVEFWTPKDTLFDRARADRVPYDAWVTSGEITATPGRAVDYAFVAQRLAELQVTHGLKRLAFDPYRIKYLEKELDALGLEFELVPHGQGFFRSQESGLWMPRSIELTEKAIGETITDAEGNTRPKLCVAKSAPLRWNVASAVLEKDPKDNRVFTKRKAKGRIDGAVALAMVVGLLNEAAGDDGTSVYETRGIATI